MHFLYLYQLRTNRMEVASQKSMISNPKQTRTKIKERSEEDQKHFKVLNRTSRQKKMLKQVKISSAQAKLSRVNLAKMRVCLMMKMHLISRIVKQNKTKWKTTNKKLTETVMMKKLRKKEKKNTNKKKNLNKSKVKRYPINLTSKK